MVKQPVVGSQSVASMSRGGVATLVFIALFGVTSTASAAPDCTVTPTAPICIRKPPPRPPWAKLLLDLHEKKWSKIGPACKSNDAINVTIPDGAKLAVLSLQDVECSATGSPNLAWDASPGLQVGNNIAGARLIARPATGVGPGVYTVVIHWWNSPLVDANYHVCVWGSDNLDFQTSSLFSSENVMTTFPWELPICKLIVNGNEVGCEADSNACIVDGGGSPDQFLEDLEKNAPLCLINIPTCK